MVVRDPFSLQKDDFFGLNILGWRTVVVFNAGLFRKGLGDFPINYRKISKQYVCLRELRRTHATTAMASQVASAEPRTYSCMALSQHLVEVTAS